MTEELVNRLVSEVTTEECFDGLSLGKKQTLQGIVALRYLRGQGRLGDALIGETESLCRQTPAGTGWFFRKRLAFRMAFVILGWVLGGAPPADPNKHTSFLAVCDGVIRQILPARE